MSPSLYKKVKCKGDKGCGCWDCFYKMKRIKRKTNIFNRIIRQLGKQEINKELENDHGKI